MKPASEMTQREFGRYLTVQGLLVFGMLTALVGVLIGVALFVWTILTPGQDPTVWAVLAVGSWVSGDWLGAWAKARETALNG